MENSTSDVSNMCPSSTGDYFVELFPLLYGIPTVILNVYLIKTIVTNKPFQLVFYYQFIVFGTGNSLYWLTSVFMDKISVLPDVCPIFVSWFSKSSFLLKSIYLVYCYAIENYFFCTYAIYAWRVAVIFGNRPSEIKKRHLKIMLAVQFVVPFSMFWLFVNTTVYYGFVQPGSPKIFFIASGFPYIKAAAASGVMFGFLCLVILLSSGLIIWRIIRISKRDDKRAERNVLITCLTFAISAAAISVYQSAIFYLNTISPNAVVFNQILSCRGYVIDFAALLPTWSLLLTSSEIRRKIFGDKQTTAVQIATTHTSSRAEATHE